MTTQRAVHAFAPPLAALLAREGPRGGPAVPRALMPLPPLTHTGQPRPSPLPGPPRSSAGSGLEPDPRAKPAHAPETGALSLSGRILSPSLRSALPPRAQALPEWLLWSRGILREKGRGRTA